MAAVGVAALGPEGGDLHHAAGADDTDGAMLHAGQHQTMAGKDGLDLLRQGGGTKVEIMGLEPQKMIPNTAAHRVGGEGRCFQRIDTL